MTDHRADLADWVVPALLAGLAALLVLIVSLVVAFSAGGSQEPQTLIEELDVYTECLNDHGAPVPRIEPGSDGGFTITVPAALMDGEIDTTVLREAYGACREVAPDLLGRLMVDIPGGLLGGLQDGWPGEFPHELSETLESAGHADGTARFQA